MDTLSVVMRQFRHFDIRTYILSNPFSVYCPSTPTFPVCEYYVGLKHDTSGCIPLLTWKCDYKILYLCNYMSTYAVLGHSGCYNANAIDGVTYK